MDASCAPCPRRERRRSPCRRGRAPRRDDEVPRRAAGRAAVRGRRGFGMNPEDARARGLRRGALLRRRAPTAQGQTERDVRRVGIRRGAGVFLARKLRRRGIAAAARSHGRGCIGRRRARRSAARSCTRSRSGSARRSSARELPILRSHFDELCRAYLANVSSQSAEAEDVALELMLPRVFACVSRHRRSRPQSPGTRPRSPRRRWRRSRKTCSTRCHSRRSSTRWGSCCATARHGPPSSAGGDGDVEHIRRSGLLE